MWKKGQEDLKFLKKCATMELSQVAQKMNISYGAVKQRLQRIRNRMERYRWFLNNVHALQKRNARFRKLTTKGTVKTEEEENEEWLE